MAGLSAKEMEYEAKIMYEALASADAPGYTSKQWSVLLTQAQEKVIREIITEGWDKNEVNRRSVSSLLKHTTTTERITPFKEWTNTFKVPLPDDYMHIARAVANDKVRVLPKDYDYVTSNLDNPFEKPHKDEFWRVVDGKYTLVITDGTTLSKYKSSYIKRPRPIITERNITIEGYVDRIRPVNCELDPIVHRTIVARAAKLADAYANNQLGYQISTIEEQSIK